MALPQVVSPVLTFAWVLSIFTAVAVATYAEAGDHVILMQAHVHYAQPLMDESYPASPCSGVDCDLSNGNGVVTEASAPLDSFVQDLSNRTGTNEQAEVLEPEVADAPASDSANSDVQANDSANLQPGQEVVDAPVSDSAISDVQASETANGQAEVLPTEVADVQAIERADSEVQAIDSANLQAGAPGQDVADGQAGETANSEVQANESANLQVVVPGQEAAAVQASESVDSDVKANEGINWQAEVVPQEVADAQASDSAISDAQAIETANGQAEVAPQEVTDAQASDTAISDVQASENANGQAEVLPQEVADVQAGESAISDVQANDSANLQPGQEGVDAPASDSAKSDVQANDSANLQPGQEVVDGPASDSANSDVQANEGAKDLAEVFGPEVAHVLASDGAISDVQANESAKEQAEVFGQDVADVQASDSAISDGQANESASSEAATCDHWCADHSDSWDTKCSWLINSCSLCEPCLYGTESATSEETNGTDQFRKFLFAHRQAVKETMNSLAGRQPEEGQNVSSLPGFDYVDWSLCGVDFTNNLGGHGPDTGPEELRYYRVAEVLDEDGTTKVLDLVIRALNPYIAKFYGRTGLMQDPPKCFGVINMLANETGTNSLSLNLGWFLTGTNTSVRLNKQFMTVADLDGSKAGALEALTFYNKVSDVHLDPETELSQAGSPDQGLEFAARGFFNNVAQPADPTKMTKLQRQRAVTLESDDRGQFQLTFSVTGGNQGRNFGFAGHSNLVPTPVPTPFPQERPERPRPERGQDAGEDFATPAPTEECANCIIWGDPHVISFQTYRHRYNQHPIREGFLRTTYYEDDEITVPGEGSFMLVRTDTVEIEGTYTMNKVNKENVTSLRGLAVSGSFLGGNVLTIGTLEGQVLWNDQEILKEMPEEFHNEYVSAVYDNRTELVTQGWSGKGMQARLPEGVVLTINRWNYSLDAKLSVCSTPVGQQHGQCGPINEEDQMLLANRGTAKIMSDDIF